MPVYNSKFKAQIAISAIENSFSYKEIANLYDISPSFVGLCVRRLRDEAYLLFEDKRDRKNRDRFSKIKIKKE